MGFPLKKRSSLETWSSTARKGSREDVFVGQKCNHGGNWELKDCKKKSLRWHLRRNSQEGEKVKSWNTRINLLRRDWPAHRTDNTWWSGKIRLRTNSSFKFLFYKLVLHCLELRPLFAPYFKIFSPNRWIEEAQTI